MTDERRRLSKIVLDETLVVRRSPEVEHERAVAIFDLLEGNDFALEGADGPYHLYLRIEDNRLAFDIRDGDDEPLETVMLPLSPLRSLIRDYFTVCEAYYDAIKTASPSRIEAIDMGRRGLHDEGAELVRERIAKRIDTDQVTARRLFTLICVLHVRG